MEYITYIWLEFMVDVGKYTINGASGIKNYQKNKLRCILWKFVKLDLEVVWYKLEQALNPPTGSSFVNTNFQL